jgi:hypothetical protein
MNNGRRSDTDEDHNGNMPESQLGQLPGQPNGQKHKKPQDTVLHSAVKKHSVEEADKRVKDFFLKL